MQTKGEYTPGPWRVDYSDKRGGNILASSGPVANTRWFGNTHQQVMEDYANARLIAAAPELLEALLAARGSISIFDGARDAVDAAIAKAKGLPS